MAGGGGAWKVAYADFVTAMMAFFMVMWLISQDDQVKDAVALHFRNPGGRYAPGDSLLPPRHKQYFKDRKPTAERGESPPSVDVVAQSARKPYVLAINNGDRTSIGTVILFAADSSELNDGTKSQLDKLVPLIVGKPQKIEIRGHAARRSPQASGSNADTDAWSSSYARCLCVLKYLENRGIPAERFRLSQAGAFEPYDAKNADNADQHSRVEVFLLGEVAEDAFGTRDELEQRFKTSGD
jgi:chemotaxis protein MotB